MITPRDFVDRWANSALQERQGAQSHFNELCQLVGHKTPAQLDPEGKFFTFEEQVTKATGGSGRADVWYKDRFAWEYKGKHKDLDAAYAQLLAYRGGLGNPPLLVVCDFLEYRIYPQWPKTSAIPFVFRNGDLLNQDTRRFITWLLESPEKFLELRQAELEQRENLTLNLAYKFAHLADLMRKHTGADGKPLWQPMQVARFLTKLVFALFAEDVDIMPRPFDQPVFRYLVEGAKVMPGHFVEEMTRLFEAMDGVRSGFVMRPTPYFNGGLFSDSVSDAGDAYEVLDLPQIPGAINILEEVSEADWRFVNPTIFGTLFEGALDESKRAQLGAHYTGEQDIRLVVEPVLMQPLYRLWDEIRAEAEPLLQTFLQKESPRAEQQARTRLIALHDRMMSHLESTRVLDPACGSGNFLYVSLRALKDLEGRVREFFSPLGLPFRDVVTPRQLYGIEKDEFAARLAHVVVWIGYLQWRYEKEGILHPVLPNKIPHPQSLPHPIIQDKDSPDEPDRIICADSILRYDAGGQPYEPDWPEVDVIIGNPPFLGDKKMRGEFEDSYINDLRGLYGSRIPGQSDLVCYWFEKARAHIEAKRARRAGLLATNSIRGGANRTVLDRIKQSGDIFYGWSDRPWVLDGAAVRISIVGFDDGSEKNRKVDEIITSSINSDLTSAVDVTQVKVLPENAGRSFIGVSQHGPFELEPDEAQRMLKAQQKNDQVVRPIVNAMDVTRRWQNRWVVDFALMSLADAEAFEAPMEYVRANVLPVRQQNHRRQYREYWWLHGEPRPSMRDAIKYLERFIVTPRVSKHRLFVWMTPEKLPSDATVAITRQDDYFFGVLHSYAHEIWSLRLGTWLGKGNDPRYTPSTTFETFPFPWPPGKEDKDSPAYAAISAAAKQLHEERHAWLNPPQEMITGPAADKILRERTLTNLYNALEDFRAGKKNGKNGAAAEFAPRLAQLHDALDRAVLSAYGWDDLAERLLSSRRSAEETGERLEAGEELLRRILTLNLARASA